MICSRTYDSESTTSDDFDSDDEESLRCLDCDVLFVNKRYLYRHLIFHVQQPVVKLDKVQVPNPPLKITLKNRNGHSFEIVSPVTSPTSSEPGSSCLDEVPREDDHVTAESGYFEGQEGEFDEFHDNQFEGFGEQESHTEFQGQESFEDGEGFNSETSLPDPGQSPESEFVRPQSVNERSAVNFSPNLAEVIGEAFLTDIDSPASFDNSEEGASAETSNPSHPSSKPSEVATLSSNCNADSPGYGSIPGAEPTPPPEPSPTEYPKIKIKTTGLFKDPEPQQGCTITEITDDNPNGDPNLNQYFTGNTGTSCWNNPESLKMPDNDNLLSMFNNEQSNKDLGYSSSSDNEFISLDTFNERNRGAMQLYNSSTASSVSTSSTTLDTLTGLPMQALAQQVSRLNPTSSNQGLHQQNVLINIQQFPAQPQQPYQPPQPMYPPHYPHPGQPPMHQGYPPYQPPNPMYSPYPPTPGYPPQHPPAPHMQPQIGQMQPPQMGPPPAGGQPPNSMLEHVQQSQSFFQAGQTQPMPPPNQMPQPPNSMQGGYRAPIPPNQRAPVPRGPQPGGPRMLSGPRPPMNRAPGMRPRAPLVRPRGAGAAPMRGQMRPRMPQNGMRPGMQQPSPIKRNIDQNQTMKRKRVDVLTPSDKDDDDCQVICMQPKNTGLPQIESVQGGPESVENSIMKLSDSITLSVRNPPPKPQNTPQKSDAKAVANVLASRGITVTASGKAKESPTKQTGTPTALSLNGAVSIVPKNKPAENPVPTVDLTDDTGNGAAMNKNRPGLPYRCDLCPAQYPNAMGLNKHRQSYHKTSTGMCELGVPLINIKQPMMMQKLSQLGINHYIPLGTPGADGNYALPIISSKNPGNVAALGITQMLSLGPVRSVPKPAQQQNKQ